MRWFMAVTTLVIAGGAVAYLISQEAATTLPETGAVSQRASATPAADPVPVFIDLAAEKAQREKASKKPPPSQTERSLSLRNWGYRRQYGNLIAEGELKNEGSTPLREVLVEVQFFDQQKKFVKGATVLIAPNPLPARGKSRFEIIELDDPEIDYALVRFRDHSGDVVPHRNVEDEFPPLPADSTAAAEREIAEMEAKRNREEFAAAEKVLKGQELMQAKAQREAATWEALQVELANGLNLNTREALKAFIKEFEGGLHIPLAEAESKADGMFTLARQYVRTRNLGKAKEIVKELVDLYPDTVSAKHAQKWIENPD